LTCDITQASCIFHELKNNRNLAEILNSQSYFGTNVSLRLRRQSIRLNSLLFRTGNGQRKTSGSGIIGTELRCGTKKLPGDFLIHTFQTKDYNEYGTQPSTVADTLLLKTKEVSHNS
jgi:hypothetical protein